MKTLFAFLLAVASLQICSAQQVYNPPVRWLSGTTAANPGDCNAVGLGAIYEQIGNPATTATRISACVQTGASAFAWQPIAYKVQTAAPAVCNVGEVWFDSDATAGSNWFGCTSANTWTLLGGASGGGNVSASGSTTTGCPAVFSTTTSSAPYAIIDGCDPTHNGAIYSQGVTSGGLALSVANIAGTATTLIWPIDSNSASTSTVLTLGPASVTCPTDLDITKFPNNCRFLTWAAVGGGASLHSERIPLVGCDADGTGRSAVSLINTAVSPICGHSYINAYLTFANSGSPAIEFNTYLPSTWTSNVNVTLRYASLANITGTPTFSLATGCVSNTQAVDVPTYNAATTMNLGVTGTITADTQYITTSGNLAVTNCAAGYVMSVTITRTDANTGSVLLQTVNLNYTY